MKKSLFIILQGFCKGARVMHNITRSFFFSVDVLKFGPRAFMRLKTAKKLPLSP